MKRSDYDKLAEGASQTQMKKVNAQLRAYFEDEARYRILTMVDLSHLNPLFNYTMKIEMENGPEGNVQVHLRDANACHGFGAPDVPERDFTFDKAELFA